MLNSKEIIETLTDKNPLVSKEKAFWTLIVNFQYLLRWEPVLKLLYIFHMCVSENPDVFCPIFIDNKMKNITEFKPKSSSDLS